MLRSITLFLIRHSNSVLIAAVLWAVAGLLIVVRTPMDAVPDLSENQVLVLADWPGQSPPEIERRVTRPLALALQGLPGVRTVRGSSDVGYSLLHLIFEDSISFDEARRRTAGQLAELKLALPAGVNPRLAADGIPTGQIFWYTVEGTNTDLAELRQLQDTVVAPQLRSVPGVAEVASVGGFVAEYHVEVDMTRLTQVGLTLADLELALLAMTQPAGGQVAQSSTSEFLVRTIASDATTDSQWTTNQLSVLENSLLPLSNGRKLQLSQVARVVIGTAPRHGVFEKDGNEAVAGIVHLRFKHNPLIVTRAVTKRLQEIGDGLPAGVRLIPCYDRTPLIEGAIATVTSTLLESLLVTSICVIVVMRHWRTSLVIVGTLPLVVLGSFLGMSALRAAGIADVQTNIMSLAGIVVSIGVLVDSSIVVADNVTHQLRRHFGDNPVQGDVSDIIADACATVGKPVFLAMLMMVVSFLPVFALQGIDGRMYRPLAWTKTLALLSAAFLTVTLVPVLCAKLIRGRVRDESESAIVRSVVSIYRPVLSYLMDHPLPLILLLCVTLIAGAAATGVDVLIRAAVVTSVGAVWMLDPSRRNAGSNTTLAMTSISSMSAGLKKWVLTGAIIALALFLQSSMRPIGLALRLPLDEGMVMDMPITVPRVSVLQAADDLKARNMVLCRFPEVRMVMGKAGRAETPFDPAPIDMIETMVEFRPRHHWPSRRLLRVDAERSARQTLAALCDSGLIESAVNSTAPVPEIVDAALMRFDAIQREVCWQQIQLFQAGLSKELATKLISIVVQRMSSAGTLSHPLTQIEITSLVADLPSADVRRLGQQISTGEIHVLLRGLRRRLHERGDLGPEPVDEWRLRSSVSRWTGSLKQIVGLDATQLEDELQTLLLAEADRKWSKLIVQLNAELRKRTPTTWIQVVCSEIFARHAITDEGLASVWNQVLTARYAPGTKATHHGNGGHIGLPSFSPLPAIDPYPKYDAIVREAISELAAGLWLWPHDSESLNLTGGEMDLAVQMPGWANVWTKPIQNRVDMLATGVNSEVGIRVLGQNLEAVAKASEEIAEELRQLPGAADVLADPIRGKSYVTVVPDPHRARLEGVALADIDLVVATSNTGRVISHVDEGTISRPLRLKLAGSDDDPRQSLRELVVPRRDVSASDPTPMIPGPSNVVTLADVADVHIHDGPATIKSENGWLRNYVRLNVRGRDPTTFVAAAQKHIQQSVPLPEGVFVEWTGQFEHSVRTRRMMLWMVPVALFLILGMLHLAFHDLVDTGLMLLSVPGALAGGVICQWMLGFPFSIAVGIGYIACFGMAAATSMVMVVYLRQAVADAGGLEHMSLASLREAVMTGAVHRLRPKLLTEATMILGLAPMLWSSGMGADVIRPMAAPVLGGILIADEVVDLLLPIAFYAVRRRRWQGLAARSTSPTEVFKQ